MCGVKRKRPDTGRTNLLSHINEQHKDQIDDGSFTSNNNISEPAKFWSQKCLRIHAWLEIIINCRKPSSQSEDHIVHKQIKMASIGTDTFMK